LLGKDLYLTLKFWHWRRTIFSETHMCKAPREQASIGGCVRVSYHVWISVDHDSVTLIVACRGLEQILITPCSMERVWSQWNHMAKHWKLFYIGRKCYNFLTPTHGFQFCEINMFLLVAQIVSLFTCFWSANSNVVKLHYPKPFFPQFLHGLLIPLFCTCKQNTRIVWVKPVTLQMQYFGCGGLYTVYCRLVAMQHPRICRYLYLIGVWLGVDLRRDTEKRHWKEIGWCSILSSIVIIIGGACMTIW